MEPVAVDDRVAFGLGDLDVLDADVTQVGRDPVGSRLTIRAVFGQRRDAGDAEELLVGLEPRVAAVVEEGLDGGVGGRLGRHLTMISRG